jgi:hypothetical protein
MSVDDFLSSNATETIYVEAGQQAVIAGEQAIHTYFATARFIDGDGYVHCYHPYAEQIASFVYDEARAVQGAANKLRCIAEKECGRLFYYITAQVSETTIRRGLIDIGTIGIVIGEPVPDLAGVSDR